MRVTINSKGRSVPDSVILHAVLFSQVLGFEYILLSLLVVNCPLIMIV